MIDGAKGSAVAEMTSDDLEPAVGASQVCGGLEGHVMVRNPVEAIAADAVVLV